jgi:hypothetical protein
MELGAIFSLIFQHQEQLVFDLQIGLSTSFAATVEMRA